MSGDRPFQLRPFASPAGEPHVYVVDAEVEFPRGFNSSGAQILDVAYGGGGWVELFRGIAEACREPGMRTGSLQAMYEQLEDLSKQQPLVLVIRGADRLLADVGVSLLGAMAHWEGFVRHGSGLSEMYLVLDTGPAENANSAWR